MSIEVIGTVEAVLSPIGYRLDIAYATEILDMLLGRRFEFVSYNLPALPRIDFGGGFGFDFRALSFDMGLNAGFSFNGMEASVRLTVCIVSRKCSNRLRLLISNSLSRSLVRIAAERLMSA